MVDYEHQKQVERNARKALEQAPIIQRGNEGLYIKLPKTSMPNPPWSESLEASVSN